MSLITFQKARIDALSVHWVGNRSLGEPIILSGSPQQLTNEKVHDRLLQFFLNNFKDRMQYSFSGNPSFSSNPLFTITEEVLNNPASLHSKSKEIANLLYGVSTHHWIKNGECWVVRFSQVTCGGENLSAFGIFKTELKEEYLSVTRAGEGFLISLHEGFNIKKIDKGCLILNRNQDQGYEMMIIDNINLQDPAEYWKEKFLQVRPMKTPYLNTNHEFRILSAFLNDSGTQIDSLGKVDKMNDSVQYMKENERFSLKDFGESVFPEKEVRSSYNQFRKLYKDDYDVEIEDEYDIEPQVLRNPKKFTRSVIKLDRNFHVYVHGNRENIVRGYDKEKDMYYYKIYFREES